MVDNDNFLACLDFTLGWECGRNKDGSLKDGYVANPYDPGGETKYGISRQRYPDLNIKELTLPQAVELYRRDYWEEFGCDRAEMPLAFCVFDIYVNHSIPTAKMLLRDGADWRTVITRRKRFRADRVKFDGSQARFLKGWLARDNDLHKVCTIWEDAHDG